MTNRPIILINNDFFCQSERLLYEFDIIYNKYLEEMDGKLTIKNFKYIYKNFKFLVLINIINNFVNILLFLIIFIIFYLFIL